MSLIRTFFRGLLYLLFLPFIVLVVILAGIWMIFKFLYLGVKYTILFFRGEHVFKDTEEDKQAKAIIEANKALAQNLMASPNGMVAGSTNTTNNTINNIIILRDPNDLTSILYPQNNPHQSTPQIIDNFDFTSSQADNNVPLITDQNGRSILPNEKGDEHDNH